MRLATVDTETYLVRPGNVVPKPVCVQIGEIIEAGGRATYPTPNVHHYLAREDAKAYRAIFDSVRSELLTVDDGIQRLHKMLDDEDVHIIGQNIGFDVAVTSNADLDLLPKWFKAYEANRVEDIRIRDKLLLIAQGMLADEGESGAKLQEKFGLDNLVARHFDVDISEDKKAGKSWRLRYSELDGTPIDQWPAEAVRYALDDPRWNLTIYVEQQRFAGGAIPDSHSQARAGFWMYLMGAWGIRTDPKMVQELETSLRRDIGRMDKILRDIGILKPKIVKGAEKWSMNKTALREVLEGVAGGTHRVPHTKGRKNKETDEYDSPEMSVKREVLLNFVNTAALHDLDDLRDEHVPELEAMQKVSAKHNTTPERVREWEALRAAAERSKVEKLLGTFVPTLHDGTHRPITPQWNELVASGRISCIRPNLTFQPRKGGVRECYVPRPGWYFGVADYSFIELVTLAQTCLDMFGYSRLADAINAGLDPHLDMAAEILGIPYEEALRRKKEPEVKDARQTSKALNFGYPGGLGWLKMIAYAKVGYGVTFTEKQAKDFKELWYRKWPEMRDYHRLMGARANAAGGGEFTIEQLVSGRVRGGCTYTSGANCLDEETEALTQRGWVRGFDLRGDDVLLTKNAVTGKLEWQRMTALHLYPDYEGPLVKFETTRFSALTTPNHRWLVTLNKTDEITCRVSEEVAGSWGDQRIHRTGEYEASEGPYDDDFLRLVGWVLTDGSIDTKNNRVCVYQTKHENVRAIDEMFARMQIGGVSRRIVSERGAVAWQFNVNPKFARGEVTGLTRRPGDPYIKHSDEEYIAAGLGSRADVEVARVVGVTVAAVGARRRKLGMPTPAPDGKGVAARLHALFPNRVLTWEFLLTLSRRQAEIVYETMLLGDGNVSPSGSVRFYTRSEEAANAFQALCTFVGKASKVEWQDFSNRIIPKYDSMTNCPKSTGIWLVSVYRRDRVQVVPHQVQKFEGKIPVWCPTVPNGFFVARRNKTVYITGNSYFQGRTADGAKRAGFLIARECYIALPYSIDEYLRRGLKLVDGKMVPSPLYGSRLVLFVHDEFVIESPKDRASAATKRMKVLMIQGMREYVNDVKVGVEEALVDHWYKGAEPVHNEAGELVLWVPAAKTPTKPAVTA